MVLYRKDAKFLGFLPRGAFEDHMSKGQMFVAIADGGFLIGYLLFRIARGKASIVHLCVSTEHRGKGVAKLLVERLKSETRHLSGIGLYCRRDYNVNDLWPRLGFVAQNSKRGRGQNLTELTYWWFDHNHPDLFSVAAEDVEDRLCVVVDSNVFFDIHERSTLESEDSKSLLEPWLQESIELCLTNEINNDVNRAADESVRRQSKAYMTKHRVLATDPAIVQSFETQLQNMLPSSPRPRDQSDIRHLAHALAAGAQFFATRDADLIERAEPLYEKFGLSVLQPAAFINQLDNLQREAAYRPGRLAGTHHRESLIKAESVLAICQAFRLHNERQSDLEKILNRFLAKPTQFECKVSVTEEGKLLVLTVIDGLQAGRLEIVTLRVSREPLAPTVVRHVLRSLVERGAHETASGLRISDPNLSPALIRALDELGFSEDGGQWVKFFCRGLVTGAELRSELERTFLSIPDSEFGKKALHSIDEFSQKPDISRASKLEHLFWPVKLLSSSIPTYIIPIQPNWAQHFFDDDLGSQLLFGLRAELNLGIEGVYYRSIHGPSITAPGRILWYVSHGDSREGAMAIKACSRLEEVIVGEAKDLYRRFRRLGVYERRDVIAAADGKPDGQAMALRFTMTERFKAPVSLDWLNSIDVKSPFPGPRKVSCNEFAMIYRKGFNLS
jgi:predicted nucleic acid-binding protein/GNAT superfamily N-acetyltransferase